MILTKTQTHVVVERRGLKGLILSILPELSQVVECVFKSSRVSNEPFYFKSDKNFLHFYFFKSACLTPIKRVAFLKVYSLQFNI